MTYDEFIEGVPNLSRIWQPAWRWSEGMKLPHIEDQHYWITPIFLSKKYFIDFDITAYPEFKVVAFGLRVHSASNRIGYLSNVLTFAPDGNSVEPFDDENHINIIKDADIEDSDTESEQIWQQFTTQWLPYFRRGCWLSGFPIECSAHEQLDWAMWLEQRDQEWAMWNEEQAALKQQKPRKGFRKWWVNRG